MPRLCGFVLARLKARLEGKPNPLGQDGGGLGDHAVAFPDDLDGVLAASEAIASKVALFLT